jgi:hypothetical protein
MNRGPEIADMAFLFMSGASPQPLLVTKGSTSTRIDGYINKGCRYFDVNNLEVNILTVGNLSVGIFAQRLSGCRRQKLTI